MAKKNTEMHDVLASLLLDMAKLINDALADVETTSKASKPGKAEEEKAPASGNDYGSWKISQLRDELIERGYEEDDVKAAPKDELIQTLIADDNGDDGEVSEADDDSDEDEEPEADEEEEEADEDDDEEESEGYTEDDLKAMSKEDLLEIVEENEIEPSGTTKAKLIAAILEYQESGDEEEAEEDDEDESEGELDEDALNAMSLAEVKAVAKEYGVKVARGASQDDIVAAILEAAGEEDDEEEDEDEDEEESDEPTRESLMAMSLKELKAFAKADGWTAAELKGADKDSIVGYYFGDDDE